MYSHCNFILLFVVIVNNDLMEKTNKSFGHICLLCMGYSILKDFPVILPINSLIYRTAIVIKQILINQAG